MTTMTTSTTMTLLNSSIAIPIVLQLLQLLERLGNNNSRRYSKSLAASEVVTKGDEDTRCATTLKKIITSHFSTNSPRDSCSYSTKN